MIDTTEMFEDLARLNPESAEHRRLRDFIIEQHLPMADALARRFACRGEPLDDLTQVARAALVCAVERFNPETGSAFVSFAVPTITGAVRRHFRDSTWWVTVPRSLKDLNTQIGPASDRLTQQLGHRPSAAELAHELGVGTLVLREALTSGHAYKPSTLDPWLPVDRQSIADSLGGLDLKLQQVEDWELLRPLLIELSERERTVVLLRYFSQLTQQEIASVVGVSQMQVCRLLTRALQRLRSRLSVPQSDTA